jgi:hypothetical protein
VGSGGAGPFDSSNWEQKIFSMQYYTVQRNTRDRTQYWDSLLRLHSRIYSALQSTGRSIYKREQEDSNPTRVSLLNSYKHYYVMFPVPGS